MWLVSSKCGVFSLMSRFIQARHICRYYRQCFLLIDKGRFLQFVVSCLDVRAGTMHSESRICTHSVTHTTHLVVICFLDCFLMLQCSVYALHGIIVLSVHYMESLSFLCTSGISVFSMHYMVSSVLSWHQGTDLSQIDTHVVCVTSMHCAHTTLFCQCRVL